jgi:hypothetical protein
MSLKKTPIIPTSIHSSDPFLVCGIALGSRCISIHVKSSQLTRLTLLRTALLRGEIRIASIRHICASIELLIAAPLQRTTKVHKSVTLDAERADSIARIQDRGRGNATKCTSEGLRVCLAGQNSCGGGSSDAESEDGGEELHFDRVIEFAEM